MAVEIPYRRQLEFEYGQVATIAPGIRRVIANNPGPFTFHGTGTYILGTGKVAVVDPGPDDQAHIDAILGALEGETISHILVTHTHMDHSPGCRKLQAVCDAPTYAYGPHGAGKIEQGISVKRAAIWSLCQITKCAMGTLLRARIGLLSAYIRQGIPQITCVLHYKSKKLCSQAIMLWAGPRVLFRHPMVICPTISTV